MTETRVKQGVSIAAVAVAGLAMFVGVVSALVSAAQGSTGGATAFIGLLATLPLSGIGFVISIVGIVMSRPRTLGLVALGLSIFAPIVMLGLVIAFVPPGAFKI